MNFPKEIEEAAIVDGCSRIGVYWRILVPNSKPVMGAMALFAFLWSWNDFLLPLVVVKEDSLKTIQLGLSVFDQEQGAAWAELMAASVMAVAPVIILYIFLQRFLVSGGLTSGLKGLHGSGAPLGSIFFLLYRGTDDGKQTIIQALYVRA